MFLTLILILVVIIFVSMVIKRMFKPCTDCAARKRFDFESTSRSNPVGEVDANDDGDYLSDSD